MVKALRLEKLITTANEKEKIKPEMRRHPNSSLGKAGNRNSAPVDFRGTFIVCRLRFMTGVCDVGRRVMGTCWLVFLRVALFPIEVLGAGFCFCCLWARTFSARLVSFSWRFAILASKLSFCLISLYFSIQRKADEFFNQLGIGEARCFP